MMMMAPEEGGGHRRGNMLDVSVLLQRSREDLGVFSPVNGAARFTGNTQMDTPGNEQPSYFLLSPCRQ